VKLLLNNRFGKNYLRMVKSWMMMLKCIDSESSNLDFVECVENFYSCVVSFCGMVFNKQICFGFLIVFLLQWLQLSSITQI
jgi:hypothetical protein